METLHITDKLGPITDRLGPITDRLSPITDRLGPNLLRVHVLLRQPYIQLKGWVPTIQVLPWQLVYATD